MRARMCAVHPRHVRGLPPRTPSIEPLGAAGMQVLITAPSPPHIGTWAPARSSRRHALWARVLVSASSYRRPLRTRPPCAPSCSPMHSAAICTLPRSAPRGSVCASRLCGGVHSTRRSAIWVAASAASRRSGAAASVIFGMCSSSVHAGQLAPPGEGMHADCDRLRPSSGMISCGTSRTLIAGGVYGPLRSRGRPRLARDRYVTVP